MPKETLVIRDLYLAAYLSFSGLKPSLKVDTGRVFFHFQISDDLFRLINIFNASPQQILLSQYIDELKTLKGQMLTLRGRGSTHAERTA